MSETTTFSLKIHPRRKNQLRLLADVNVQIENAIETRKSAPLKYSRAEIARALNWDQSALTRKLKPNANLELESIADLAYALGRRALFFLVMPEHEAAVRRLAERVCDARSSADGTVAPDAFSDTRNAYAAVAAISARQTATNPPIPKGQPVLSGSPSEQTQVFAPV
jgi:transcriptional regulator with XRE-family HTH domain